ncbi:transcription factor jungbrunnen 1 [Phtheirospermum japonicum]|uniref:Transcription factor jungbrunnen 1 n=1 Tax=Phtheirospermum japonicum TaxID=374723 RepID=A0A830CV86_9LAMI|nr:transcription factor jungbrunnen 1 [Phtheirospermum japonicum]
MVFFCMRGRKYRNSVRSNWVLLIGTGFWRQPTSINLFIHQDSTTNALASRNHLFITEEMPVKEPKWIG